MLKIVAILGIVVAVCSATSITIVPSNVTDITPLALDGMWTDCGVGTLDDVIFEGCTRAPCQVSKGSTHDLRIAFRPRDFHCCMDLDVIIHQETQLEDLFHGPVQDATVQPGQLYNFDYQIRVPNSISGAAEFRIIVSQNWVQEICLIIPLNIA